MTIEDVILSNDKKGISKLKKYLNRNFCESSTKFILQNCKRTIITTGFYVNGTCETDGLVGAINLASILSELGADITFITDKYCFNILQNIQDFPVIEFPLGEIGESFIDNIIKRINPTLIIAIERSGASLDNKYYNFKGQDITKFTGKIDILFEKIENSVSIGDTGNEIGMGNLYKEIVQEGVYPKPSKIKSKHLVLSSISNWGCYGVIRYISKLTKRDYLSRIEDLSILKKLNLLGVVDGVNGELATTVDTYSPEDTKEILEHLKCC
ncbi:MAG: glutamate cyclase domain-containing protein [Nanoarchaeota archaeon]